MRTSEDHETCPKYKESMFSIKPKLIPNVNGKTAFFCNIPIRESKLSIKTFFGGFLQKFRFLGRQCFTGPGSRLEGIWIIKRENLSSG
jgi:hypothetical protein